MVDQLKTGDFEFTRDDALKLSTAWQTYVYTKQSSSWAGDNVENMIEELCLAWGFSVEEVRATWASNKKSVG